MGVWLKARLDRALTVAQRARAGGFSRVPLNLTLPDGTKCELDGVGTIGDRVADTLLSIQENVGGRYRLRQLPGQAPSVDVFDGLEKKPFAVLTLSQREPTIELEVVDGRHDLIAVEDRFTIGSSLYRLGDGRSYVGQRSETPVVARSLETNVLHWLGGNAVVDFHDEGPLFGGSYHVKTMKDGSQVVTRLPREEDPLFADRPAAEVA